MGAGSSAPQTREGVQWFYRRRERWEAFGEVETSELEEAWARGQDRVEFGAGRFPAVLSERVQHNHDAGTQRGILRGSWFFQRSDGSLYPFAEDVADTLERTFPPPQAGIDGPQPATAQSVVVDAERRVYPSAEDGEFVEVRDGSKSTRWVTFVYRKGALPVKKVRLAEDVQPSPADAGGGTECGKSGESGESGRHRLVQWWCQRAGVWEAYSEADNGKLEEAFSPPRHAEVPVCGGEGFVDIVSQSEHLTAGVVNPVIRTKWHVQRSDGTLLPFNEADSAALDHELVVRPAEFVADHLLHTSLNALRERNLSFSDLGLELVHKRLDAAGARVPWEWVSAQLHGLGSMDPEQGLAALVEVLERISEVVLGGGAGAPAVRRQREGEGEGEGEGGGEGGGVLGDGDGNSAEGCRSFLLKVVETHDGASLLARALALGFLRMHVDAGASHLRCPAVGIASAAGRLSRHFDDSMRVLLRYGLDTGGALTAADRARRVGLSLLWRCIGHLSKMVTGEAA
jgi:hypothetical protein